MGSLKDQDLQTLMPAEIIADQQSDVAKLVVFLLRRLGEDGYARMGKQLVRQVYAIDPATGKKIATRAWKVHTYVDKGMVKSLDMSQYALTNIERVTEHRYWNLAVKPGALGAAVAWLEKAQDVQLPVVSRDREWMSFRNGIVCMGSVLSEESRRRKATKIAEEETAKRLDKATACKGSPLTDEEIASVTLSANDVEAFWMGHMQDAWHDEHGSIDTRSMSIPELCAMELPDETPPFPRVEDETKHSRDGVTFYRWGDPKIPRSAVACKYVPMDWPED